MDEYDDDQCRQKLEEYQKKLFAIRRRLVGRNEGRRGEQVLTSVMELEALAAWIARNRGAGDRQKEDVVQKLKQLEKIRKELEKSAIESQNSRYRQNKEVMYPPVDDFQNQTKEHICDISKDLECEEKGKLNVSREEYFSSDKNDDENSSIYFDCGGNECHMSEQMSDQNKSVCMNFVSAKNEIQKLTLSIEDDIFNEPSFMSQSSGSLGTAVDNKPDSLGTAMSEDEGLGEESRRGDSTGPSSLLEMHDSSTDLMAVDAVSSKIPETNLGENENMECVEWIGDLRDPRNSLELCLCTITKLKESLSSKEQELSRLAIAAKDRSENAALQNVILNLQQNIDELQSKLRISEKTNSTLKEQVLELEEAENDARLQCQRLDEKLIFLQEKDSHFQTELSETKRAFEMCVEELSLKDVEERELRSQLKYMEVLVQKYEDQVRNMETTESALRKELNMQKYRESREKFNIAHNAQYCDRGTQTYYSKLVNTTFSSSSEQSIQFSCNHDQNFNELTYENSLSPQKQMQVLSSSGNDFVFPDTTCICTNNLSEHLLKDLGEALSETEHKCFVDASNGASNEKGHYEVLNVNENDKILVQPKEENERSESSGCLRYDSTTNPLEGNEPDLSTSLTCPVQKELLGRLRILLKEDADLQQQLHHVDQINLTLWKKLHSLQFHIGECKRENMPEGASAFEDGSSLSTCSSVPLESYSLDDEKPFSEENERYESQSSCSESRTNIDYSEEKLRARLIQLEKINSSFEKELEMRETIYYERERKHAEWMQTEQKLMKDLATLVTERDCLLDKVSQLEREKIQLASRVEELQLELEITREKHEKNVSQINAERGKMTIELQTHIEYLLFREKEQLKQIATLKSEKKKFVDKSDFEKLKTSYVDIQIELNGYRDKIDNMMHDFDKQLEFISRNHAFEKTRLLDELKILQKQYSDCEAQLKRTQLLQNELENAVKEKKQWMVAVTAEFKEEMKSAEKGHRLLEAELKNKLRMVEEETAITTKALSEERIRLEKELHENINDLRCMEGGYKKRIEALEGDLLQLQEELRQAEGNHCEKELLDLRQSEVELRAALEKMEHREGTYRATLARANGLVTALERGYRERVEKLKASERGLRHRVGQLEAQQAPPIRDARDELRDTKLAQEAFVRQTKQQEEEKKLPMQQEQRSQTKATCDPNIKVTGKSNGLNPFNEQSRPIHLDSEKHQLTKVWGSSVENNFNGAAFSAVPATSDSQKNQLLESVPEIGDMQRDNIDTEPGSETVAIPSGGFDSFDQNPHQKQNYLTKIQVKENFVPCKTGDTEATENIIPQGDNLLKRNEVDQNTMVVMHEDDTETRLQTKGPGDWACQQLEECMASAMDAMRRDIQGLPFSPNKQRKENESGEEILPPFNFRVVQQVGPDTVLVGWEYSNASSLEGFEVYVDGQLYQSVNSADRTKAVIGGLDLGRPLTLGICAVASWGRTSEPRILRLHPEGPFCFQEKEEDMFDDDPFEKQLRPYSMEW